MNVKIKTRLSSRDHHPRRDTDERGLGVSFRARWISSVLYSIEMRERDTHGEREGEGEIDDGECNESDKSGGTRSI